MGNTNNLKFSRTMTRARKINAIICIAIAVAICVGVTKVWHSNGCEVESLIIGCIMYTGIISAIGFTIDQTIKEYQDGKARF
jgi:uncharacterized membrane protein YbaN (DUF454 family)